MRQWVTGNPLFALVVFALVSKALVLFVVIPAASALLSTPYGIGFADNYDLLAQNLLQGNGYRFQADTAETLMREPGYPLFLAGIFSLLGSSIEAARVANLALSLAAAWLVWKLANRITGHNSSALIASAIFLFYPGTIIAEARGGVEILFIAALLLFMLGLHQAIDRGRPRDFIVAGLLLGAVVLIRSTPLLFPPIALVYLLLVSDGTTERLRAVSNVVLMTVAMVLVMSPWIYRNYQLVGEIVPTSSVQGVAAQTGQYICENLSFENGFEILDKQAAQVRNDLATAQGYEFVSKYYQYFYRPEDELRFNGMLMQGVIDKYSSNPALYARCVASNAFNFWFSGKSWSVTAMNIVVQLPLLALAVAGAISAIRKRRILDIALITLFIFYVYGLHAAIHAQVRYSIPLVPFLAILASFRIQDWWQNRQREKGRIS